MSYTDKSEIAKSVNLTRRQVARAKELRKLLEACKFDLEVFTDSLGFGLSFSNVIDRPALLDNDVVILKKGLSKSEQVLSVAHELCHHYFHAHCNAHRDLPVHQWSKNEGQAEMFAAVIMWPTLIEFESEEAFMATEGSESAKLLRLHYWKINNEQAGEAPLLKQKFDLWDALEMKYPHKPDFISMMSFSLTKDEIELVGTDRQKIAQLRKIYLLQEKEYKAKPPKDILKPTRADLKRFGSLAFATKTKAPRASV